MRSCDTDVRSVVYNDDNIVSVIKETPHSYYTILGDYRDNGSVQLVLRRRVSRLIKQSRIWRIRVPGTRFGLVLLLHPDRDYYIVTTNSSLGVNVYYCYDYSEDDFYLYIGEYWVLKGPKWSRWVHKLDSLKLLKSDGREGGVMIW